MGSILESWLLLCLSSYEMGDDAIVPFWWFRMPVWPPFLAMMQLLTEPWINWWISRSSPRVGSQNTHYSDGLRDLGEPQQVEKWTAIGWKRLDVLHQKISLEKRFIEKKYIYRSYIIYIYIRCLRQLQGIGIWGMTDRSKYVPSYQPCSLRMRWSSSGPRVWDKGASVAWVKHVGTGRSFLNAWQRSFLKRGFMSKCHEFSFHTGSQCMPM